LIVSKKELPETKSELVTLTGFAMAHDTFRKISCSQQR